MDEGDNDNRYCCVGAVIVSGSSSDSASSTSTLSCSTTIPLSEKSYSSLAQAAATSLSSQSG